MGKNAQRRRGEEPPKQPEVDHFKLTTESYINLRRYLGSKPHDETRQLIQLLEQAPAVTADDIANRDEQAARLIVLEEHVNINERFMVTKGSIVTELDAALASIYDVNLDAVPAEMGEAIDKILKLREDLIEKGSPEPDTPDVAETPPEGA